MNLPRTLTASLSLFGLLAVIAAPQLSAQATHVSHDWAQATAYSYSGDSLRDYLVNLQAHAGRVLLSASRRERFGWFGRDA